MSRKINLSRDHQISWPACCAKCGKKEDLTWASATSGRVTSVAPTLSGAIRIKSELLDLNYPVCQRHAKGLAMANAITRNTFGFKALRGMAYILGPMSVLFLLALPIVLISPSRTQPDLPLAMIALYVALAGAFLMIIRAFRTLPLRIDNQTKDDISIKFGNAQYASAFARLNREGVVRS